MIRITMTISCDKPGCESFATFTADSPGRCGTVAAKAGWDADWFGAEIRHLCPVCVEALRARADSIALPKPGTAAAKRWKSASEEGGD